MTLSELLKPGNIEKIIYPITIMEGNYSRSQWNNSDHNNKISHILDPIRFGGISPFTGVGGILDLVITIPEQLGYLNTQEDSGDLDLANYPNKDIVYEELSTEPIFYIINDQESFIEFLKNKNIINEDDIINPQEVEKYDYKTETKSFGQNLTTTEAFGKNKLRNRKKSKRKSKKSKRSKKSKKSKRSKRKSKTI